MKAIRSLLKLDLLAVPANCPYLAQFTPECLFHNSVRLRSLIELTLTEAGP